MRDDGDIREAAAGAVPNPRAHDCRHAANAATLSHGGGPGMVIRAMGYGRFSDDEHQNCTSTVDQARNIERYIAQRGYAFVGYHSDDGITGAILRRPGIQAIMRAITDEGTDVLVIEDIDRMGRDEEYLQHLKKLLRAHRVVLHTLVGNGPIDDMLFSLKAMFSEQTRSKIAYQTRRGLIGKAAVKGSTGGRTLGYVREITGVGANGKPVDRIAIDPDGAELVLAIFTMYDEGRSLLEICTRLDSTGVPTPNATRRKSRSTHWNASTLSGNIERGEGILNNRRYIGESIFNRRQYMEMPDGNGGFDRRPRTRPTDEWTVVAVPELRIIDQDLWDRVKARQLAARAERDVKFKLSGNPLSGAKRPGHLLTGLVICGSCGENYVASGGGRWRCREARAANCRNGSITGAELEERVMAGLQRKLLRPDLISRFADAFQKELKAKQTGDGIRRADVESRLAEIRASIAKLTRQLESVDEQPRSVLRRLVEPESGEDALAADLVAMEHKDPVRLPANYERVYLKAVSDLADHLLSGEGPQAREAVRRLVEHVVVEPGDARGGKTRVLRLQGDLFRMIDFALDTTMGPSDTMVRNAKLPLHRSGEGVMTSLVAGTGFEPVTFRL